MICPNCGKRSPTDTCQACHWSPDAKPGQVVPQADYAYLLSPEEQAYGAFRLALFKRAWQSGAVLKTTADGLSAWLDDPAHERWASAGSLAKGCPSRPERHSLLTCLLEEIQSYAALGSSLPAKPDSRCCNWQVWPRPVGTPQHGLSPDS